MFQGELELITGVWNPGENKPHSDPRYDPSPKLYGVENAPVHPRHITHCTFLVSDFDRSMHFYGEVAGLNAIHVADDNSYASFEGGVGRYDLSILQAGDGDEVGMHHCGFELESEDALEKSVAAVTAQGVAIEKQVDSDTKRSFFVQDDDKIRWEFFVDRKPNYASIGTADQAERPYLA